MRCRRITRRPRGSRRHHCPSGAGLSRSCLPSLVHGPLATVFVRLSPRVLLSVRRSVCLFSFRHRHRPDCRSFVVLKSGRMSPHTCLFSLRVVLALPDTWPCRVLDSACQHLHSRFGEEIPRAVPRNRLPCSPECFNTRMRSLRLFTALELLELCL